MTSGGTREAQMGNREAQMENREAQMGLRWVSDGSPDGLRWVSDGSPDGLREAQMGLRETQMGLRKAIPGCIYPSLYPWGYTPSLYTLSVPHPGYTPLLVSRPSTLLVCTLSGNEALGSVFLVESGWEVFGRPFLFFSV